MHRLLTLLQLAMLVPVTARRSGNVFRHGILSRDLFPHPPLLGRDVATHLKDSHRRLLRLSGGDVPAKKSFKVVQVHIVHRHGDRTPITPLKDEAYWESSLPRPDVLNKIAANTKLIQDESDNNHAAGGRGAFGKLTQMGLFQMVELGNKLREELESEVSNDHHIDKDGNRHVNKGRLFTPENPLHPSTVKIISTNFPRTIQSVQGVLVGLFPNVGQDEEIEIDVRHTNIMIPDPQPRQSQEQVELEVMLSQRPHLKEREAVMKDLAVRATDALRDILGEGAFDVSFGIGEEKDESTTTAPLPWAQLSEITKCLQVRDLLPPSLSVEDQEAISSHAAWRWFENLRDPRLAFLAMNNMVSKMASTMHRSTGQGEKEEALHIYSAHDSTLIGLICAYRLEQPVQWPEYGSYLKIELIEVSSVESDGVDDIEHFVRFSLNGEVLRSYWGVDEDSAPAEMIALHQLAEMSQGVSQ